MAELERLVALGDLQATERLEGIHARFAAGDPRDRQTQDSVRRGNELRCVRGDHCWHKRRHEPIGMRQMRKASVCCWCGVFVVRLPGGEKHGSHVGRLSGYGFSDRGSRIGQQREQPEL